MGTDVYKRQEGYLQAVLVYSPDRLSRKYAYQVLLMEEFARHGVELSLIHILLL